MDKVDDSEAEKRLKSYTKGIYNVTKVFFYIKHNIGWNFFGVTEVPELSRSFQSAYINPNWLASINREFEELIRRCTWTYVHRSSNLKVVPFKWTFGATEIYEKEKIFLWKTICVLRGDLQEPYEDLDPYVLYEPFGK